MARAKRTFLPLSESPVVAGDLVVLTAGEERSITVPVDVNAGEERRVVVAVQLGLGARLTCVVVGSCRGRLVIERRVELSGEGAVATLSTAIDVVGAGSVTVADDVMLAAPKAEATIAVRHVVRDAARSLVRSRVVVLPAARQSKAFARADQMLLGAKPFAGAIPELDIAIDDVSCGHAASVARPKAQDRFYLASRGLTDAAIDDMLAQAFLCPAV